ncbi:protein translocase subunit SecDF [Notoacmeibacter sp. MSK16QG-6]|uniref:protein translocase subunit SecDF n=1 Tax=Notoacmeibacter sp. MSK16QG-6 TaxID=2957982 RepID=UPI0020A045D6|nr:protein translocase subunit SecDF [Notoacmeibacter sp. MSK16QG-6]MCP1199381.1 protein translocase subunit SecDF [Notoacmeibacter sp. MSK16QG-6]
MLHFARWKTILIWLTILVGVIVALPNLFSRSTLDALPDFVPDRQMTLGLDLQGGSHILLQIDTDEIRENRLKAIRDEARSALRGERIGYTGLAVSGNTVQFRLRDPSQLEAAREALSDTLSPISAGMFSGGQVTEVEMEEGQNGLIRLSLTDQGMTYRVSSALTQSVEVVGRRVNELGTTEPVIQRQGDDRILVQVPGLDDPERLKNLLGQTAQLTFQMVDTSTPVQEAIDGRPPAGTTIMYSTDDPPVPYLIEDRVIVSGENLVDAQPTFDQRTGEAVVSFRFDNRGAVRFGQATQQNVGRPFAIILDEAVISAPVIREPITGGSGQISGSFTTDSAKDLAVLLRAGALPATLSIVEERTVGPGLGQDSIDAGLIASIVGAILVVIFMVAVYGKLGVIANIALAANITLLIAILTFLGATLTLPGIAGIVLTVGMAVDSNVLIYERIREERRNGRKVLNAIETGFERALSTIVDANLTTLIAAVILFYLGTGPVRGFAVTLAIGIVTTVFTAFTLTRWMVGFWYKRTRAKELPGAPVKLVPDVTRIPFMWLRKVGFAVSALLSIAALVAFFAIGMNLGIDFKGGTLIEVQSKSEQADISDIRGRLSELNLGDVQVQSFGSEREVLIRVASQEGGDNAEQSAATKVQDELREDYDFRRTEVVGPTISSELARAGTIGVAVSLFAILLYIWFRFEWQFAIGAIISTMHDVILTLGFFVLTGIEFNVSSIAAILTIVGYSLNDTVVVYDRVRENLRRYRKMPLPELLDLSMNDTLSRTTMTSLTTLLALGALFFFGGEVIRSFTAAMIFGVFIGTYSSIFNAAPLLILFKLRGTRVAEDESGDEDAPAGARV